MSAMPMRASDMKPAGAPGPDACECVKRCAKIFEGLRRERQWWETAWHDIARYVYPGRYHDPLSQGKKDGRRDDELMYTSEPEDACDNLRSGLSAGCSNPAQPWYRYGMRNPALRDDESAKSFLYFAEETQRESFFSTNYYDAISTAFYLDAPVFGTGFLLIEPDAREVYRCITAKIGSFWVGRDPRGGIKYAARVLEMNADQMVDQFGEEACPPEVVTACENNRVDAKWNVIHFIGPRDDCDEMSDAATDMPFESLWWIYGKNDCCLRESGYRMMPVCAPRWDVRGNEAYGYGRGHKALPIARELHTAVELQSRGVAWLADPAMLVPSSFEQTGGGLQPGQTRYVPLSELGVKAEAAYQMNPQGLVAIGQVVDKLTAGVQRTLLNHLFLMLQQANPRQATAQEIMERAREKATILGPYLERNRSEGLRPSLDLTFMYLYEAEKIPQAPDSMLGEEMPPEFISELAQAQKIASVAPLLDFVQALGSGAMLDPTIVDNFNGDEYAHVMENAFNAPPKVVKARDEVTAIRAQRAKQQQLAQMAAMAQSGAGTVKDLAAAPMTGDTALTRASQIANQYYGAAS